MSRRVQVVGHRGACKYAPENTLASFELAVKMGVDSLETDIRTTKDGVLVLIHDTSIDRTSDGSGSVEDFTYNQLRRKDFGSWFSADFSGEGILSLVDFLNMFGNKIHLNLEIKAENIYKDVIRVLKNFGISYSNYVITAFELEPLLEIREFDSQVIVGYLTDEINRNIVDMCLEEGIKHICPNVKDANLEDVEYAHSKGLIVRGWGVQNLELMERAVLIGCDGMTVDFPDELINFLSGTGRSYKA